MPAPDHDPAAADLALLVDAAHAAGRIAARFWQRGPEAWDKPGGAGPVTEADIAIDQMLHAELRAARPDFGWLSEEIADSTDRLSRGQVFIVDPIDGTRAFIAGERSFAHALAIATHGRITAAVVFLPKLDLLYAATLSTAATLNGMALCPALHPIAEGAQVLTQSSNLTPAHWRGAVPGLSRHFRASLAYRLCLVAEGRFDASLSLGRVWEWDSAAASLIAERAGAQVSDRHGRTLAFNAAIPQADGVVAANALLHADLLARLAP